MHKLVVVHDKREITGHVQKLFDHGGVLNLCRLQAGIKHYSVYYDEEVPTKPPQHIYTMGFEQNFYICPPRRVVLYSAHVISRPSMSAGAFSSPSCSRSLSRFSPRRMALSR